MIYTIESLVKMAQSNQSLEGGRWVPARPLSGPFSWRIRAAWLVLTGKADAVTWGSQAQKCDGDHGGHRCGDPECWQD